MNEKFYHLLDALRTTLTLPALAADFQQRTGQTVALDQLQQLTQQLVEQGVVVEAGKAPATQETPDQTANSSLGWQYRRDLLSPAMIAPIARLLQVCFKRGVAAVLLLVIIGAHVLAYSDAGFASALQMEGVSLPLLAILLLVSVMFHEFGHLAACHRWECPHGPLGFGLYFFNPVFYVDVTAAWRLNRYQRALVDVGGVYLQLLFVPISLLLFWATQDPTYLTAIAIINVVAISNFEPFMKLDGYWLLSDLTGVPNLHTRTFEALQHLFGWVLWRLGRRSAAPPPTIFSQWSGRVRGMVLGYLALSIIALPYMFFLMGWMLFSAITTYPALWQAALSAVLNAGTQGDIGAMLPHISALFFPTMALLGAVLMLKLTWHRASARRRAKARQSMRLQPA